MNLTQAGHVFYERCVDIIEAVERAEASVAEIGAAPRGILKVTAPLGLGRRVIAPLVARYHDLHQETNVRLRLSDYLLDLVQESIDVAIRLGSLRDSTLTLRKISDVERVLCASPAYLDRNGTPESADDLLKHVCLMLRYPGSQQRRWKLMMKGNPTTVPISGPIDCDDSDVLTAWALEGRGIVMAPRFDIARYLASKDLVPIMPHMPPQSITLGVLYPTRKMLPSRVKTFVETAVEGVRKHIAEQLHLIGEKH